MTSRDLPPGPYAVGIGLRAGAEAAIIAAAVRACLGDFEIACLATVDRRANEPGLVGAAQLLGVPVVVFPVDQLARVPVPNPSARTAEALGTPSVAEAAALSASRGGELTVPKTVISGITLAAALIRD
ncbi:cobalamin biosynthesis protein [Nocardia sp. NBC_01503]|uniref:cobalamin biosynthesis protein n=1 Tax=Nocardia sp. NBC_01503 TaxID=2975997 RepID=UPI002E7BBDFD|nr:cobalamin biosynthesis protein [Nocardia sp. NBC_01503]WTL29674.1 cobalamin biosynthesis protein [Nocardia sp. NBC_01503]